jgi:gluconolactonase
VREVAPQVASAPPQPAPIVEAPRPVAPTPPRRPEPVRVPPPPPTPAPRPDAADPDAADPDADEVNPFGLQPLRARLEPSRCALVLVDLQNDMISPGGAFADSGAVEHAAAQQVAANAARLLAAARRLGVLPVHVWTLHAAGHPQLARHAALMQGVVGLNALVAGTWGAKPVRGLEPARGEDIVEKTAVSGWEGTRLETLLRSARRDTILVGGAWTNTGVEHLVRTGADKGFRMIVAEEACASMGADWHRAAIEFSLGAFADLARVQDVLDALNDHLDIT